MNFKKPTDSVSSKEENYSFKMGPEGSANLLIHNSEFYEYLNGRSLFLKLIFFLGYQNRFEENHFQTDDTHIPCRNFQLTN